MERMVKAAKAARCRCVHGRQRNMCKECWRSGTGGSGFCVHGRQRSCCKVCRGGCSECGGGRFMAQALAKAARAEVAQAPKARRRAEGAFCVHGRRRRDCRECGGSAFCVHGRRRRNCRECGVQETVARHASTPRTVLQQAPTEGMMDGEGWDALAGELFTEVDWESKLHAW